MMSRLLGAMRALLSAVHDRGPKGRMARGILANVYDKGAVLLIQLLTIPVLTHAWSVDGYGIWLMLMTVPVYLALSDMGFGTAAGVLLTQSVARGEHDRAVAILQSTIAFVMATVSVAALAAIGFALWYWRNGRPAGPFFAGEIALSVVFVTGYALVFVQMSILTVVWRATHKYAFAMTFAGTWILVEGMVLVMVALASGGIVIAAMAYFVTRLVGYFVFVQLLRRHESWVKIGVGLADRDLIRALVRPSLAALSLTGAMALSLQGVTLALGAVSGAASVAVFGAARTLSRAPLQLAGLLIRPSIPELTRALTEGNSQLSGRLNRINLGATLLTMLPLSLILINWGPKLVVIISGGKLAATTILFVFLTVAATANAIWSALATPLIAMNRQGEFSTAYLALTGLALCIVATWNNLTVVNASSIMAIPEVLTLVIVCWCSGAKMKRWT